MNEEIISLDLGEARSVEYRVHPLALLEINEIYYRRKVDFVIGVLHGVITTNRIDITHCSAVPMDFDSGEAIVDKDMRTKINEMHRRNYPKETVVGWFTTLSHIDLTVAALHVDFAGKEAGFVPEPNLLPTPILLMMDPSLSKGSFGLKGYVSVNMNFCRDSFAVFQTIRLKVEFFGQTSQELRAAFRSATGKDAAVDLSTRESIEQQLVDIISNLTTLEKFVKEVKEGKHGKDPKLAKRIKNLLNIGLDMSKSDTNSLVSKNNQDIMMIAYLCDVIRTQGAVQDKLNKFIFTK